MTTGRTVLYCHCACANVLDDGVKAAVLAGLSASGAAFEAVADLCELAAHDDPRLAELAEAGDLHVVACHPRAVKWLFARAGAPLPPEATVHNMRRQTADEILAVVVGDGPPRGPAREVPAPAAKQPGEWIPWFPVIDYDRCEDCKQCLEFCLFGTYALDEAGTVRVVQPDHCKLNCPACARVCPASAIIFPKFKEGPISGDEGRLAESPEAGITRDMAALGRGDVVDALRQRAARARAAAQAKYQKELPEK